MVKSRILTVASSLHAARGLALAAALCLTAWAPAPASAQSLGDALRNMQRDLTDLFGTEEQRRRMIRRGEARRAGQPIPGDEYERVDPLDSAPTPRFKPTEEEAAANAAARRERGVYNDPEFDETDAPLAGRRPRDDAAAGVSSVARGGDAPAKRRAVDPLDALLGPEAPDAEEHGAARGADAKKVAAAKSNADPAPEKLSSAERPKPATASGRPQPIQAAALSATEASTRSFVSSPAGASSFAGSGPATASASAATSGGLLSEPAVQITLAFLVGAGLLGLAIMREWSGRGRST